MALMQYAPGFGNLMHQGKLAYYPLFYAQSDFRNLNTCLIMGMNHLLYAKTHFYIEYCL